MAIWLMCLLASGSSAMPYSQAGLTREEAAAHILNRLTFGPKPGQVEEVMRMGLDAWLERQLTADLPEDKLKKKVASLPAIAMSDVQ